MSYPGMKTDLACIHKHQHTQTHWRTQIQSTHPNNTYTHTHTHTHTHTNNIDTEKTPQNQTHPKIHLFQGIKGKDARWIRMQTHTNKHTLKDTHKRRSTHINTCTQISTRTQIHKHKIKEAMTPLEWSPPAFHDSTSNSPAWDIFSIYTHSPPSSLSSLHPWPCSTEVPTHYSGPVDKHWVDKHRPPVIASVWPSRQPPEGQMCPWVTPTLTIKVSLS